VTLALVPTPLVAILRGVKPDEAEAIAAPIVDAGFGAIEVPLNSPEPLASIAILVRRFGERILVGAGTVLEPYEVDDVAEAGARLVVAPNADRAVIERAAKLKLVALPGVATMTEAFAALKAGASGLKLFPGEAIPPEVVRAWRSVLPKGTPLLPVGGITPERIAPYRRAGADGFGIGSALYKPGASVDEVARAAEAFVKAWREAL
jgi:2-dehydro-3-deoxyphosphogalactonate aldolase